MEVAHIDQDLHRAGADAGAGLAIGEGAFHQGDGVDDPALPRIGPGDLDGDLRIGAGQLERPRQALCDLSAAAPEQDQDLAAQHMQLGGLRKLGQGRFAQVQRPLPAAVHVRPDKLSPRLRRHRGWRGLDHGHPDIFLPRPKVAALPNRRNRRVKQDPPRLTYGAARRSLSALPAGETGFRPGAEGATAPETLRPKDRAELHRWKAAAGTAARRRSRGSPLPEISQAHGQRGRARQRSIRPVRTPQPVSGGRPWARLHRRSSRP